MRVLVSFLALMGIVATLLCLSGSGASAHAGLGESDPAANAVLPEAPDAVTMRFTEPLERTYSRAELYDQAGNLVPEASTEDGPDEYEMILDLPPDLPDGTYSVLWRTLSTADGHTAQNYFAFTIGTESDVGTVAAPVGDSDSDAPSLWLQTVARWAALLGLAAAVATWPIWIFVIRPSASPAWQIGLELTRHIRRFALVAIVAALAGNILALFVQSAALTEGSLLDKARSTLGDTRYGELWFARIALLMLYAIALQWVAWWWPRHRALLANLGLLLAFSLPVPFSMIAHASAQTTGRTVAIMNDVLHLLAAAVWVGGLMLFPTVLLPAIRNLSGSDRRRILSRALPRFSTIALIAWTTMTLSGVYSAWLQVGSLDALLDTDYGNALLVKLALLVPILMLASFNLVVVTRRLSRHTNHVATWTRRFAITVGTEAAIAVLVLLVVGTLTAQAPARESLTSTPDPLQIELTGGERDASLSIAPGTPGPNTFELTIGGEPLSHSIEVLLRVESSDQDTGEKELAFEHASGNTYTYTGSELSLAGQWDFELIVRPPDAFEWRAFATAMLDMDTGVDGSTMPSWVFSAASGVAGIALTFVGLTSVIGGWRSPRRTSRLSIVATGALALIVGAAMLLTSRTEVATATARTIADLL